MNKIIWVDDEIDLLKPHVMFLQGKGYEVDTCNNGYDAVEMISSTAYDLVILDEMMPGMTGLETLPLIKAERPSLPVIMVTKSEEGIAEVRWLGGESLIEALKISYATIKQVVERYTRKRLL